MNVSKTHMIASFAALVLLASQSLAYWKPPFTPPTARMENPHTVVPTGNTTGAMRGQCKYEKVGTACYCYISDGSHWCTVLPNPASHLPATATCDSYRVVMIGTQAYIMYCGR